MARERTIPSTSTFIQDYGLNVTPPPAARNKRVVIIGTSEDGPMYEPILIDKPEDGEFVWGRNNAGDLVRGIYECWDVQTGYPTVVGVRIGNGKQSALEIEEYTGAGVDAPQSAKTTSLKLQARYPGQIYNQVTVGYNDSRQVSIYNPKTGIASTFTVDTEHPNNPNAMVHNVAELVDAINADRNLRTILSASYTAQVSDFEVAISGTSVGVNNQVNKVTISLQDILQNNYVTTSGFLVSVPTGTGLTASNDLVQLLTVEAVSVSNYENLRNKGTKTASLKLMPLDGHGQSRWDTIQAMKDYNLDNYWMTNPSGKVVSEFIYALENESTDEGPTVSGGLYISGVVTNKFSLSVPLCLDDSEQASNSGVASGYLASVSSYSDYSASGYINATCRGIDVDAAGNRPSGLIRVFVSTDADINGYWQELPYSIVSGVYMSSYDKTAGKAYFSIGSGLVNPALPVSGVMRKLVNASGYILPDRFIKVSANTVKGTIGEVETLPQLEDSPATALSTYFVRGNELVFNAVPAFNMVVNYGTRITYEPGSTVNVDDINNGFISFATPGLLPGPAGAALSNTKISYLRLRYSYMPAWPNITAAAKALSGGTNGNQLSNKDRADQLQLAYDKLRNYEADIWVPMGAFIDATAERFNPITGLKETIPMGYHSQMEDFLEDLSINALQPHAVLGVSPMGVVTQANKDLWVNKLTKTDVDDDLRGANVMSLIQNKFISVAAFEPIFLNIGRGQPYTANGQAIYAGVIASLPYDISPTNKTLLNINNVRFDLSVSQLEALNSMRYVTMKNRPGRAPVIVEDVTAAPYGSDFVNWSTFSITAEAANRVKRVANDFIGRPNSVEVRTSLEQLISNTLMSMDGLRAFDFSLTSTPTQQVLGIIEVDLILVPIFTIKKIRTTVKLRKNLPTTA